MNKEPTQETIESVAVADVFEVELPLKYNGFPPDSPLAKYRPISGQAGACKILLCDEDGPLLFELKPEAGLFLASYGITLDKILSLDI